MVDKQTSVYIYRTLEDRTYAENYILRLHKGSPFDTVCEWLFFLENYLFNAHVKLVNICNDPCVICCKEILSFTFETFATSCPNAAILHNSPK